MQEAHRNLATKQLEREERAIFERDPNKLGLGGRATREEKADSDNSD